jgi:hypothetical protein
MSFLPSERSVQGPRGIKGGFAQILVIFTMRAPQKKNSSTKRMDHEKATEKGTKATTNLEHFGKICPWSRELG